MTARNYIRWIYEHNCSVGEDLLSRNEEDYDANESYRLRMNCLQHHIVGIEKVPIKIEEGEFEPEYARYY